MSIISATNAVATRAVVSLAPVARMAGTEFVKVASGVAGAYAVMGVALGVGYGVYKGYGKVRTYFRKEGELAPTATPKKAPNLKAVPTVVAMPVKATTVRKHIKPAAKPVTPASEPAAAPVVTGKVAKRRPRTTAVKAAVNNKAA